MTSDTYKAQVSALVEAADAGREALEFIHLQSNAPPKFQISDLFILGALSSKMSARNSATANRSNRSKAVTASRRYSAALANLGQVLPDHNLLDASSIAPSWPDRLTETDKNFPEVREEMVVANKIVLKLKQNADLGRPLD